MSIEDVVIAMLVVAVTAWLAWGRRPLAAVLLVATSLLFSAALFLPGAQLRGWVGAEGMQALNAWARGLPWSLGQISHFVGFMWMALVLWALRPDWRVWRCVAVLVLLAFASEAVQGLTDTREARLSDVQVNLLGSAAGLVLAALCTGLAWLLRRVSGRPARRRR